MMTVTSITFDPNGNLFSVQLSDQTTGTILHFQRVTAAQAAQYTPGSRWNMALTAVTE